MEFKFLVLPLPAAFELGETSRTPSFFMSPVYSAAQLGAVPTCEGPWTVPTPGEPRAVRSSGGDAGKKEEVRFQRGPREDLENESLFCKSVSAVEIRCFCSSSVTLVTHSFSAAACF